MPLRRHSVAVTTALVLNGCVPGPVPVAPREPGPPIRTDSLVYHLREQVAGQHRQFSVRVNATYTNRTRAPVYFARCRDESPGPLYNVWPAGPDSVARTALVGWACPGGVPLGMVPPGGTLAVVPLVGWGDPYPGPGTPMVRRADLVGRFRLVFELSATPAYDPLALLPRGERQSNVFEVRP